MSINDGYVQVVNNFFFRFGTFSAHFWQHFGQKLPKIRKNQPLRTPPTRNHSRLRPHAFFSLQWTDLYTTETFRPPLCTTWCHFRPILEPKTPKMAQNKWKCALQARYHSVLRPHGFVSLQRTGRYTIETFKPSICTTWGHLRPILERKNPKMTQNRWKCVCRPGIILGFFTTMEWFCTQ